jgi:hypothetical protein
MVRGKNPESDGDREVAVDVTLEVDVRATEDAIDAYLSDPSATRRDALLAALEELDQQIGLSDDYESRIAGSAAIGYGSKGSVIGETSSFSAAEEIPEAEFVAQTLLIKAAKSEIAAPAPESRADLQAAVAALAAVRDQEPSARE